MILEACVGNIKDALSAQSKGTHQIELCDRLDLDGTSPTLDVIRNATEQLNIDIKVIVNPYPFEYSYTIKHMDAICRYIEALASFSLAGIVFGPTDKYGMPDLKALTKVKSITDLPITYHKAIDACPNRLEAVHSLAKQGVITSILTSGGCKTAKDGIPEILKMKEVLTKMDSEIYLIAAGRITDQNLPDLHKELDLTHYHGKLIVGNL